MKFIVDTQLPKSLSDFLNQNGFDSIHVLELTYSNETTDIQIVKLAIKQKRIVITKDTDFLQSYILSSIPPRLIIVRTENMTNKSLLKIFKENIDLIIDLITKSNLIQINKTEIVEHE